MAVTDSKIELLSICGRIRRHFNRKVEKLPAYIHLRMCLAVPGKIIEMKGNKAIVDYGGGTKKEVDISLVNAKKGDWVIVHVGFAIRVIPENEAKEILKIFGDMYA